MISSDKEKESLLNAEASLSQDPHTAEVAVDVTRCEVLQVLPEVEASFHSSEDPKRILRKNRSKSKKNDVSKSAQTRKTLAHRKYSPREDNYEQISHELSASIDQDDDSYEVKVETQKVFMKPDGTVVAVPEKPVKT